MTPLRTPWVGRGRARTVLHDRLSAGHSVLVRGVAGIGKTRLSADALTTEPVASRVVSRLIGAPESSTVLLATLADGPGIAARATQAEVYARLMSRWHRRTPAGRLPLVFLDDAHHADRGTATLLRRGVESGDLQVVACQRTPHPLPPGLQALLDSGGLLALTLDRLPDSDIRRLVLRAGGVMPAEVVDAIVVQAHGNPLYARELTAAARSGRPPDTQDTLEQLVGQPVLACPPRQREILELLAVVGRVPSRLLHEYRHDLARLRATGLVVHDADGVVHLDHPLRRQWLAGELQGAEAQVLASFLDALGPDRLAFLDPVTRVDWCRRASRPVHAGLLAEAASSALARGDPVTALRLLGADHELADPDGLRARALVACGQVERGMAELDERLRRGPPSPDLAVWCVRYFAIDRQDLARAHQVTYDLQEVGTSEAAVTAIRCQLWLASFVCNPERLPVDGWRRTVESIPDRSQRAEALAALASAVLLRGGPCAAATVSASSVRCLDGETWRPECGRTMTSAAIQSFSAGRVEDAVQQIDSTLARARRHHDVETLLWMGGAGGMILATHGRIGRSLALSVAPGWAQDDDQWVGFAQMCSAVHQGTLAYRGSRPVEVAPEAADGPGVLPAMWARAQDLAAGVAGDGHDDEAVLRAVDTARQRRHAGYAAFLLAECPDLASAPHVHRAAAALFPPGGDGLAALVGDSARARLDGDADQLLALGLRAERAGWVVPALRLLADVGRLEGAASVGREGQGADAGAAARIGVLRLLERWDGDDPWWCPALPSPRQREIAHRIASGASTRQIAEHLTLSPRTVENHLQRIFEFTGVHDREVLARGLARG